MPHAASVTVAASPGVSRAWAEAIGDRLRSAGLDTEVQLDVPHAKKAAGPFPPEVTIALVIAVVTPTAVAIGNEIRDGLTAVVRSIADRLDASPHRYTVVVSATGEKPFFIYTIPADDPDVEAKALSSIVDHALTHLDAHFDRRWNRDQGRWVTLEDLFPD